MSQKIADALGIEYVGLHFGVPLYQDPVCGGSFSVPVAHDAIDVATALDSKRAEFKQGFANG